ncbi:MAG: response regulator [Steroidobacteraceae bacterium]
MQGEHDHPLVRVLLAEDNDDLRIVMPPLLDDTPDLRCVAATSALGELPGLIREHQAQVVVLDIELRDGSALKQLPTLSRDFPATRFVIHSGHCNPDLIRSATAAGAAAYVRKSGDIDELIASIRHLMREDAGA